jgi:hypothetical protein
MIASHFELQSQTQERCARALRAVHRTFVAASANRRSFANDLDQSDRVEVERIAQELVGRLRFDRVRKRDEAARSTQKPSLRAIRDQHFEATLATSGCH